MKAASVFASLLLLIVAMAGVAQAPSNRLMTNDEYKLFLSGVDKQLPIWETTLRSIDLEKYPTLSYAQGKDIADQRNIGLMEASYIRTEILRQRQKRTIVGELALQSFLQALFDVGQEIVWEEDFTGLTLTSLDHDAPALSASIRRIGNDVLARVDSLEKRICAAP